jgi:hypothetical protein
MESISHENNMTKFKIFDISEVVFGSLGIAPTRNCTYSLQIGLVVAGGGFYSYYTHQGKLEEKS